jgi:hypothetical protein
VKTRPAALLSQAIKWGIKEDFDVGLMFKLTSVSSVGW